VRAVRRFLAAVLVCVCLVLAAGCGGPAEDDETREKIVATIEKSGEVTDFRFVPAAESGKVAFECTVEGQGKYTGTYDGEWAEYELVEE